MNHLYGLLALALIISACNLPGPAAWPTESPVPTTTPIERGAIEGVVWHDLCANLSGEAIAPSGCTFFGESGSYLANGILEEGEPFIRDVLVGLGNGPCPAEAQASRLTDALGRYAFEDLLPGEYCIAATVGDSSMAASLIPGSWTSPIGGMQAVVIGPGEHRTDVNFGWDYFTMPVPPTTEPNPTPTPEPQSHNCTDSASFIRDASIVDGTRIDPGDAFRKTWRLRNDGSCNWSADYDLVFVSGDRMDGDRVVPLKGDVLSGQTVDLTVEMRAPRTIGTYWGFWMLRNAQGALFGIGEKADSAFWVKIRVEPTITEWRGEYFNNRKPEGNPVLVRNDEEIDYDWGRSAPAPGFAKDNFSARWTRRMRFDAAVYRFSVRVDDGVRLWVDDRLVIDEWEEGSVRVITVDLRMVGGEHDLKLEYYEREGEARISLDYEKVSIGSEQAWIATYWFNRQMDSSWALTRTVSEIDFDWGSGSPALGIPEDEFSAEWSRQVEFEPGVYRFYARADDGVRVTIDGDRVIDEWHDSNASVTYTEDLELSGSKDIRVSYFERRGQAKVLVFWEYLGLLNQPPVVADDNYQTTQDQTLGVAAPGVLGNDEDPDSDSLIAILVSATTYGTIALNQDGSFIYLPDPGFSGEDGFTYQISDGSLASNLATVVIIVDPANAPPVAQGEEYELKEDESLIITAPGILENDSDPEGQPIEIMLEQQPVHGSLTLADDGSFEYVPDADFNGQDSFAYRISDGVMSSEAAIVQLHVEPVNDTPNAADDFASGNQDRMLEVDVLANDTGIGDGPITIAIETAPAFGTLDILEGMIRYTPDEGFVGEDGFSYRITDLDGESTQASVVILVTPFAE